VPRVRRSFLSMNNPSSPGWVYGNPRNWPFDHWISQSPNIIVVSVYYRLDSFGFLSTPAFADGTLGDLNAGFRDQVQSLRWIKAHVSAFGGDPNRVTINGQSAGAASVELHLVANEGEELFQAAIAQSVYRDPIATPEQQVVRLILIKRTNILVDVHPAIV
jgi:carboxylesterase type B